MTTEEILAALDRRREELGLTWQKAALLAEVNQATVHGWVRKSRMPNLYNLVKVCEAMGLEVSIRRRHPDEEMRQAVSERTEHIIKWINDDVIPTDNPGEYFSVRKCSNCEKILSAETEYCHGCGARMEVSGDGHEKIQD